MLDTIKKDFKISEETLKNRKETDINLAIEILSKFKGKSNAEIYDILKLAKFIALQNCLL